MNKQIKKEWLKALRSGDYKQGAGSLRSNEDEFCCLGVLCDVMGEEWELDLIYRSRGNHTLPHTETMNAAGLTLTSELPSEVTYQNEQYGCLASLNDAGATFDFIADVIEEQF